MTKSGEPPVRYFAPPEPETDTASEGAQLGQELARRYLPQDVKLAAAVAFGDSGATAGRLIAQIAGVPETLPGAAQPGGDGGAHA